MSRYFHPATGLLDDSVLEPPSPATPSWEQELHIRVVEGRGLRAWLDRAVEYGVGEWKEDRTPVDGSTASNVASKPHRFERYRSIEVMLPLTTVVAVAVACGVVVIVIAVVGTIVWIRIRQERLSLVVARAGHGCIRPHGHSPPFNEETLTEISREEGSALRQYGQLPYGRPSEWGLLASQESLYRSRHESDSSSNLAEKARDLRRSFSWSKTLRPSRSLTRPRQGTCLAPLTESNERLSQFSPVSPLKEPISISAVDGALELPTETTPRQTPEKDDDGSMANPDPTITYQPSSVFPLLRQHERPSGLFPLIEVSHEATGRVRGGSITAQTAGAMPEHPVPPPPCAYPPNRFRLSKNDSMCFSSLSLETADSSILDESRQNYAAMESEFTSPHLPPCPTFAPYSANDVGRTEYERRNLLAQTTGPPTFFFPAISPTKEGRKLEPDRTSPRRSLTAHSPSQSMDRISPPPRRSESLSAKSYPRRDTSSVPYMDFNRIPPLNAVGQNAALVPHFSQLQRHSMYGGPPRDVDPFYGGGYTAYGIPRKPDNLLLTEGVVPASYGHLRPPLPSALKGGSGPRKGHRRQNCVRISIHPPITFGGPAFSPMVEEPEDAEGFDMSRSEVPELATPNTALSSTVSPAGRKCNGTPKGQQTTESTSSPGRTRKHKRGPSTDSTIDITMAAAAPGNEKTLPEIQTTILPTTEVTHMPQTPSPDKSASAWMVTNSDVSPAAPETPFGPRSSRRSIVKGPRSQPAKSPTQRNRSRSSGPLGESTSAQPTGVAAASPAQSTRNHSTRREQLRISTGSLQRTRSNAPSPTSLHERSISEPTDYSEKFTQTTQHQSKQQSSCQQPQLDIPKPTSSPNNKPNNSNNIVVPIWEDSKSPARKPPANPFQTDEPVELPDTSPRRPPERTKSRASASTSQQRKPRRTSSRQGFTTPTKKAIGLGIGAATPGSLYDGDGFLKE
ncbi:hypothetical protein P168DRAFT_325174 [Aspergillus campestris IBT 28561]|uniref:Transmembrane protein n=1 Tax=Aspergillus campestris (strain IBT 28561) TaxID=1392248 RepID=A0A2I1D8T8_ASPC2|nr:uncharacterized protein P168DRAFT_325174 [Aspergillus campestris IBT 28561]PKY06292.1 hypothetical protein P168DRAFT_325174 [Aspergillus campestris IBT 28561]